MAIGKSIRANASFRHCDVIPPGCFDNQAWVDEMRIQIEAIVELEP